MEAVIPMLDEFVRDPFDSHILHTPDGTEIVSRVYSPDRPARKAIVIAPAMGVPQTYYHAFACWLKDQGFLAVTFDYRGMGLSRKGPLRKVKADIFTWAREDAETVLQQTLASAPGLPLVWVGHSLGGQIIPFLPSQSRIDRLISIGCGSGYWRQNTPALKRIVWFMWYVVAPLTTPMMGYFPGARFNMVGDLPRGVIEQWRRWCLHPEYALGAEGSWVADAYERVRQPFTVLSFTDDEFMTLQGTRALHDQYSQAPVRHIRIDPAQAEIRRIGHFGFFRRGMQSCLWERYFQPLINS